jgi:hypothetical protein
MNIAEWERRIKSAKFHVEQAKTNFQKQTAALDLRALNAEFVKAWAAWSEERELETNRINQACHQLEDGLHEAKQISVNSLKN